MMCRRNAVGFLLAVTIGRSAEPLSEGPYCWTGSRSTGEDTFAPCRDFGLTTGRTLPWVDVDVSKIAGLRMRDKGRVLDLSVSEILSAMERRVCVWSPAKPESSR